MSVKKDKSLQAIIYSMIFLVLPFLGSILALINHKNNWSKNIFWFFVVFSGYTFVISTPTMDANYYRDVFLEMTLPSYNDSTFYSSFKIGNGMFVDLVFPVLSFIASRITKNINFFFAFLAFVFGFFYSRNIWYLLKFVKKYNVAKSRFLLIFSFIVTIGFWQVNGFRFWTGAHMFIYGLLPFILEKKKNKLWACGLSVFTHFSFVLPVVLLLVFLVLKNKTKLYFILFVISMLIMSIDLKMVQELLLKYTPSFLHAKISFYTDEVYAESLLEKEEGYSVLAVLFYNSLTIYINILFMVLYLKYKNMIKTNDSFFRFFNFTFYFLGITSVLSLIPSLGRFYIISQMFGLAFLIFFSENFHRNKKFHHLKFVLSPLLIGYCFGVLRLASDKIGVLTFVGNFMIEITAEIHVSIKDFIGV